jgi:arginine decarboxylase
MKKIQIGNRIPFEYFKTTGFGESDITIHAGSYHLALKDANIERANIMTYSSILPRDAKEVEQPSTYTHGEVMESIIAECTGKKGDWLFAGITYGTLYDKKTGERFGGLVCENSLVGGSGLSAQEYEAQLKEALAASLNELYINGFDDQYELRDIELLFKSGYVKKGYGTVLCAICFTSYEVPIVEPNTNE